MLLEAFFLTMYQEKRIVLNCTRAYCAIVKFEIGFKCVCICYTLYNMQIAISLILIMLAPSLFKQSTLYE